MSKHNLEIQRSLGVHARDSRSEHTPGRGRAADTASEIDAAAYDDYDRYLQNLASTDGMREAPGDE